MRRAGRTASTPSAPSCWNRSDSTWATSDRALSALMSRQLDYADIYFQYVRIESWTVEDGIVKHGAHSVDCGVGVRALELERGRASPTPTNSARPPLGRCRESRPGNRPHNGAGRCKVAAEAAVEGLYPAVDPLASLEDGEKVGLLADLDGKSAPWTSASFRSSAVSPGFTRPSSCRLPRVCWG